MVIVLKTIWLTFPFRWHGTVGKDAQLKFEKNPVETGICAILILSGNTVANTSTNGHLAAQQPTDVHQQQVSLILRLEGEKTRVFLGFASENVRG